MGFVQTDESAFEAEREAFIAGQPKDTCTMSTAADAMQKSVEAMEKAKEATEVDTPTDAEGSEGESVSGGENTTQTLKDDQDVDDQDEDLTATWLGTAAASVAGLFGASRKKRKG